MWASWQLDLPRYVSVDGMRALVDAHAPYGALVFMGLLVAAIFTHVPMLAHLLIAVGGVVLGAPAAFAYGWLASMVGTTSTFLLVRYVAREPLERALAGRLARLRSYDERLARNGFWTVLALRILFFLAPFLNWEIGLTGVRVRDYVAATALGLVPQLAPTVFFADSLAPASAALPQKLLLGAPLILAILTIATITRRLLNRKTKAAEHTS